MISLVIVTQIQQLGQSQSPPSTGVVLTGP